MKRKGIVESIGYSILNGLELKFERYDTLYHVAITDIKFGGNNCEISRIVKGSLLSFKIGSNNMLYDVVIMSDSINEIDDNGNLIKW